MSDKRLVPKIYWEIIQLNNKHSNNPSKNGECTWIYFFPKRTYRWPTGTWKDVQHDYHKEMQIKTTMRSHCIPFSMFSIKKTRKNKSWRGCRQTGTLVQFWWDCKLVQSLWKIVQRFLSQSVQSLSRLWLFATPWTPAHQASLSITNSRSLFKLMSTESVMPSNHLIPCHPLLLPPSIFPASGSFQMSQFFISGGRSIGVSTLASVLPMSTQDWSPLGWTGWISLQSKGLSRVFSNTTVQKHQFFGAQLSL